MSLNWELHTPQWNLVHAVLHTWVAYVQTPIGPGLHNWIFHKYVPRLNQGFTHGSIFHLQFGTAGSGPYLRTSPKITIGHSNGTPWSWNPGSTYFTSCPKCMYYIQTGILHLCYGPYFWPTMKYSRNSVAVKGLNVNLIGCVRKRCIISHNNLCRVITPKQKWVGQIILRISKLPPISICVRVVSLKYVVFLV